MDNVSDEDVDQFERACRLLEQGKNKEALLIFEALSDRYPDEVQFCAKVAVIYLDSEQYDLAEAPARAAVRLKPDSDLCSRLLFHTLLRPERFEDAFEEMKRFILRGGVSPDYDAIIAEYGSIREENEEK